jgi:hypothetical protein
MAGMKFRKLRIAWSVGWGLVAVLLCALWVRSYTTVDFFLQNKASPFRITASSHSGRIVIWIGESRGALNAAWSSMPIERVKTLSSATLWFTVYSRKSASGSGIDRVGVQSPHWFAAMLFITLGSLPWIHLRYSLRTLLIATTLVALLLGLFVWLR